MIRGVTSSVGSATPVRDRMMTLDRPVGSLATTTGGPPLSARWRALALRSIRPLSAASLATCMAWSKRSRVRMGTLPARGAAGGRDAVGPVGTVGPAGLARAIAIDGRGAVEVVAAGLARATAVGGRDAVG